ncbi:MAG: DUF4838 domain-containing protein [Kiritimatiellaeota bacterium]|nr:DUF4838 domain-containing protein [Kiritimatiellota bacterium]
MTGLERLRKIVGLCLGLLAVGPPAAPALEIVRDGTPRAVIVCADSASEQVRNAAELLRDCVQQASGARLELVDRPPAAGAAIYIGAMPAVERFGLRQNDLDDDGFEILFPTPESLVILGPTDWGTEFGVYEFLERYVGVRWLLPGPDGTDVPARKTLAIEPKPVREQPAFISRLFSGLRGKAQADWARRNRMHGRISFHHNLLHLLPPETYTKTHPEFFPFRKQDGKRYLPPTNSSHGWQPCFTAPGIVEAVAANIGRYFADHPDAVSCSLGVNDSSGYCQCDTCLARLSGGKNFLGRIDYSDLYYDWCNRVIREVAKKNPDKLFGCLAYSEVAAPPAHVAVSRRLVPYMTYDRMKWVDPELRRTGEELTRAWHKKSPMLGWYDYIYGTPYVLPRVWFHHMADYYRFGYANGVRALYAEAYPNWGEGPKLYVSLKLQWAPERDVDALLDEWYRRCVGEEAAPYLARYYAHWEDFWTRRVLKSAWFTRGGQYLRFNDPGYLRDVSLDEIRQSRRLLETVVAKARTPKQKARAELLFKAYRYYEATAYAFKSSLAPDGAEMTAARALHVLDTVADAQRYAEVRRRLALEEFPKDPVLLHPLPMDRYPLIRGDSWGGTSVWSVYDLVARRDPAVLDKVRALAVAKTYPSLSLQARTMLELAEGKLKPLTGNPSFEEGTGPAAASWSWWVKWGVGRMLRSDAVAHTGRYSVLCDGMKRGGPVQSLPIRPGRYALTCFVFLPSGQDSTGTAELSLTPRDAKGRNLPAFSTRIRPAPGRWTAMAVVADLPATLTGKRIATVLPILIVNGFKPGEKLYFDDLVLARLD